MSTNSLPLVPELYNLESVIDRQDKTNIMRHVRLFIRHAPPRPQPETSWSCAPPPARPILMPRLFRFSSILLLIAAFSACARKEFSYQRFIMGGPCQITLNIANPGLASHLYKEIDDELVRDDSLLNYFSAKSLVHEINTRHRAVLTSELTQLFQLCDSVSRLTNGCFDISIAPLMKIWGFYEGEAVVPETALIAQQAKRVDFRRIELRGDTIFTPPDMEIDLSGIAQGWAADRIAQLLKSYGVDKAIIDIGGEVICIGASPLGRPWRVGIRHPRAEGVIETVEITNAALATSGDYEKFFIINGQRFPHIIDPRTGAPARDFVSVTIFGTDAAFCDALATAVCVMGAETGVKFLDSLRIKGILYYETDGTLQRRQTR